MQVGRPTYMSIEGPLYNSCDQLSETVELIRETEDEISTRSINIMKHQDLGMIMHMEVVIMITNLWYLIWDINKGPVGYIVYNQKRIL